MKKMPQHIWVCPACGKRVKPREDLPLRSPLHREKSYCGETKKTWVPVHYVRALVKR